MAINKAEWEIINNTIKTVDQNGIQEMFHKYMNTQTEYIDKNIRSLKDDVQMELSKAKSMLKNSENKLNEMIDNANKSIFSEELDRTLSVLEKHGYFLLEHETEKDHTDIMEMKHEHYGIHIVDVHDVLKYVCEYCQKKAEADGYIEYRKIREAGLTERGNTHY